MKKNLIGILLLAVCAITKAQQYSDGYVIPADTAVQNKLSQWQNLKFGLFMHWGPYSEWGVILRFKNVRKISIQINIQQTLWQVNQYYPFNHIDTFNNPLIQREKHFAAFVVNGC